MGDVDNVDEFVDYVLGSTAFWVIVVAAVLIAVASFVGGGRR